ncbi:MAG: GcrA family cell cycle regulator [Cypionkella sp.]
MWVEGKTAKQIAMALDCGASRSAVIGKVHRLKLPKRANPVMPTTRRVASAHGNKGQPKVNAIVAKVAAKRAGPANPLGPQFGNRSKGIEPFDMEDGEGIDTTNLIGIMDLTARTCRWPHGDPLLPGFGYCGKSTKAGSVWCPSHHDRVFLRSTR